MSQSKHYPFWLGGVAASMAACCTHPLDLAKVRMQTLKSHAGHRPSTITILRATIAESGLRSIYTGLSASVLRQMTYSLTRLGVYEEIKSRLSRDGKPSTTRLLLGAMAAGGIGGVAGNPADVLLVRMTSDTLRPPEKRFNYSNALTGLVSLLRSEGLGGLFKGVGTNTFRAVLMNGSQVCSYDLFKSALLGSRIPLLDYQLRDNLLLHTLASCAAGTVATTVCAPADVLRSRIMAEGGKSSLVEIFTHSLQKEGPRFLFKGWTPAFVRLGPNTVLLFVFFEQLKKGWSTLTS